MTDIEFARILESIQPESLQETIQHIADTQTPGNRSGVGIGPIIEALTQRRELGYGSEGWQRYLRLKRAVMDTVALLPGMSYVESDA
ncbi:MAG: hypothetical protein GX552_18465 [Chloroflexi bacterium]|jgi:hypothetical protein|nr:hypothetical protein [Chloroflexota bacterium]